MARSANDQLGEATERRYRKKILKMQNYYMTIVMAVNKRCAASGRALQAESAANEIQHVKIQLWQTLQNRSKGIHKRRFAVMSSLQFHAVGLCLCLLNHFILASTLLVITKFLNKQYNMSCFFKAKGDRYSHSCLNIIDS